MKARAVGFRLVVKPLSVEESDAVVASAKRTGIIVQEQTERQMLTGVDRGIVLEVGPDAFVAYQASVPWCKVGDMIAYTRNAGKFVRISDDVKESVLIINDEDVVTVLED
jgi:co-chaperonin GroES (HSP10)